MKLLKKTNTEEDRNIWNSDLVKQANDAIENGYDLKASPFYEGEIGFRKGNIIFEYSDMERDEIKKCARDVIYFANNYAYTMTDYGMQLIELRDYQKDVLRTYQAEKEVVFMASRQVGKCCLGATKIQIRNTNTLEIKEISIYTLYKPKTLLQKIKYFLYKFYDLVDRKP